MSEFAENNPRGILFAAAWRGNLDKVKEIIENKKKLNVDINDKDENCVTALRFAAQFDHLDIVKYLLENGADPNIKAHDQLDPLLSAIEQCHVDIVKLLLQNGANPNSRTDTTNPLLLAREKGLDDTEQLLLEHGARYSMGFWKDHGCNRCILS